MKFTFILTVLTMIVNRSKGLALPQDKFRNLRAYTMCVSMSCHSSAPPPLPTALPHYYCKRIILWLSDQQSTRESGTPVKEIISKFKLCSQNLLPTFPITLSWAVGGGVCWWWESVRQKSFPWMLCFPPKLVRSVGA